MTDRQYVMTFIIRHQDITEKDVPAMVGHTAPVTAGDDGPTLAIGTVLEAEWVEEGVVRLTLQLDDPFNEQ